MYLLCPNTGNRCRKLYLIDSYFLHRKAFKGCFYEKQTQSHKNRKLHNYFKKAFGVENVYERLNSKYFKTHYAGELTKRYLKLLKQAEAANAISDSEILELMK